MSEQKLKPCPFCGSRDVRIIYNECSNRLYIGRDGGIRHTPLTHSVKCLCCDSKTGEYEDCVVAIAAWNRRANDEADC